MKCISDNDAKFPEHYSHRQHIWLSLTIALALIIGGCTSTSAPTPSEQVTQGKKKEPTKNLVDRKEEPKPSIVEKETSPIKEKPPVITSNAETKEMLSNGERVYQEHCANCHGVEGDGQGEVAQDLSTKPRDFTKGVYKFRSTPSGQLPTDDDLLRTISVGIPGTSMEGYNDLPKTDRLSLIAYIKTLSPRFLKRPQGKPIIFPSDRTPTQEAISRGLELYRQMGCAACHGDTARGDGELAQDLTDTTGSPIQPADLTSGRLKSGPGPKAIYRTIMTGLDGTPMPSYGDSLDPEEGWELALYILSLANTKDTL